MSDLTTTTAAPAPPPSSAGRPGATLDYWQPRPRARRPGAGARRILATLAAWSVVALIVLIATMVGTDLRGRVWDFTERIHYAPDMHNAYRWGSRAADRGYLDLYETVLAEARPKQYGLDYVPLRLWVMTQWVKWTRTHFPDAQGWQRDYAFNAPLLRLNTVMEWASALAALLIVRCWRRRTARPPGPDVYRLWVLPLVAFLLVWFNPASIVSAHVRPTWDVWVVPFYLGAVLTAMHGAWFTAGVLVGVGAMFKGQQFIVAPLFVLWPVVLWRWGAAVRAVLGGALAVGLVVSPWMVTVLREPGVRVIDGWAVAWLACGVLAAGAVVAARFWVPWMLRRARVAWGGAAGLVLLVPALLARPDLWYWLLPAAVGLALALALLPLRKQAFTLAGVVGVGLLLCMPLFHGSDAWIEIAFHYGGMIKYPRLEVGGTASLAGLLQNVYGWDYRDIVFTAAGRDVTIHQLLIRLFGLLLVVSIVAVAVHFARRSDRFLVAVATPWIVFFTVAPLMHERYLLWGAVAAAVAVGAGRGAALLGVFFSLVSWVMSVRQIMGDGRNLGTEAWPTLGEDIVYWLGPTVPPISWAVLLATAAWLYLTLTPGRRLRGDG